jgi:uncharacterized protein YgiM (DUF1202 family)
MTTIANRATAGPSDRSYKATSGYVNAINLNLRSGPGSEYSKITTLHNGTAISCFNQAQSQKGDTWVRVSVDGTEGWVLQKFVSYQSPPMNQSRVQEVERREAEQRQEANLRREQEAQQQRQREIDILEEEAQRQRQLELARQQEAEQQRQAENQTRAREMEDQRQRDALQRRQENERRRIEDENQRRAIQEQRQARIEWERKQAEERKRVERNQRIIRGVGELIKEGIRRKRN